MSIKDKIERQSVNLILSEIKEKGFVRVARPEKVIVKVFKHTGICLINNNGVLKMIYENKNGYNVCKEGSVIIKGVEHYVINGFVLCDSSLNNFAWNTTEKNICLRKVF